MRVRRSWSWLGLRGEGSRRLPWLFLPEDSTHAFREREDRSLLAPVFSLTTDHRPPGLALALCRSNHLAKGPRIAHGQVGQHLAIEAYVGRLHIVHQTAVGRAVQAGGGVDANDPQSAQVAPAGAAGAGGEPQALQHP